MVSYKTLVFLYVVLVSLSACRFGSEPTSTTKHDFGQTSVAPAKALVDCSTEPDRDSGRFPASTAYIKKIAHHIMKANPSTFSGAFSPDNFCFRIEDNKTFNAFANPTSGTVTFHTGTLESLTSDGNVAAFMAHELAHITMQHLTTLPITHSDFKKVEVLLPSNSSGRIAQKKEEIEKLNSIYQSLSKETNTLIEQLSKASEKDAEAVRSIFAIEAILRDNIYIKEASPSQWQKYANDLNTHYLQIMGGADAEAGVSSANKLKELGELEANMIQKYQELEALTEQFKNEASRVVGIEQVSNGMEREADEVGLELYLRSRMIPGEFLNSMGKTASLEAKDSFTKDFAFFFCLKNMISALKLSPSRGTETHPSGCWRLFNTGKEVVNHEDDYRELLANATLSTVPGPVSLAEVKAEISSIKSEASKPKELTQAELDRKDLCLKMEGLWEERPLGFFCSIPIKMTIEEERAMCSKFNGFWHETCKCLPKSWEGNEIDTTTCSVNGSKDLSPFDP